MLCTIYETRHSRVRMNISMLNRKEKASHGGSNHTNGHHRRPVEKGRNPPRRRFIISPKAPLQSHTPPEQRGRPGKPDAQAAAKGKGTPAPSPAAAIPGQPTDLTETIKTLLHLAHENGHVTYD